MRARKRFLGLPGSWTWPGWDAVLFNLWNTTDSAVLWPPKVFGWGWSFNFGYVLSKRKPWWKRFLALCLGTLLLVLIPYAIVVVCMLVYFLVTPNPNVITITIGNATG